MTSIIHIFEKLGIHVSTVGEKTHIKTTNWFGRTLCNQGVIEGYFIRTDKDDFELIQEEEYFED